MSTIRDTARPSLPSQGRTTKPSRLLRLLAVLSLTATLAGCAGTNLPGSVKGGECRVFERPQYAVLGKRQYDQRWIDGNVEAGVGACGWKRPAKRPAALDPPARPKAGSTAPLPPPKRRGIVRRTVDRVLRTPAPVPRPVEAPQQVDEVETAPPPPSPPVVPPPPPPPPRKPIDELLSPTTPLPPAPVAKPRWRL
jgi:hypothetical protein